VEEKKLATWGTDVPDGLVLDEKLLADALKKVILVPSCVATHSVFVSVFLRLNCIHCNQLYIF